MWFNDVYGKGVIVMIVVHPSDRQLAEWADAVEGLSRSAAVSDHLAQCAVCRDLVAEMADAIPVPSVLPGTTLQLGLGPLEVTVPDTPEQGQVWRVRWEGTSQLAMVWNADIDWVGMIPVTPDPSYADDSCVILTTEDQEGHAVLWLGLETPLPYHTLDCQVSVLPTTGLGAVRTMLRRGKSIDLLDFTMGQPIVSAFDDRYLYRSELGDAFGMLAESEWNPQSDGPRVELSELVEAAGTNITTVAEVLSLEPPDRLRLKRGFRPLTMQEADQLVSILNVEVSTVIACNPVLDRDLVRALSKPRWRSPIDATRRATGEGEVDVRQNIAYAVSGLAARSLSAPMTEDAWHERLSLYFAA